MTGDMKRDTTDDLFNEIIQLCRQRNDTTLIGLDERIWAVRAELLNRMLTDKQMGRLCAMDAEYNIDICT